ncbi:hypothetical protein EVAR_48088_1 [Eumeta japonica]|uniref:Uncharacterized protein n=1 Tax=Eumeta variegata TaxID=151549 RepID=A0A4C1XL49_EUMVA|nr:hypothetical protein EVAR_48088_1 [Eumeta japonica]
MTCRGTHSEIRAVSAVIVLGVLLDEHLSFAQHMRSVGKRAARSFSKVSRVSAASVYRTVSTVALPVLAGMLPAYYEVTIAGRIDNARDGLVRSEVGALRRRIREEMVDV